MVLIFNLLILAFFGFEEADVPFYSLALNFSVIFKHPILVISSDAIQEMVIIFSQFQKAKASLSKIPAKIVLELFFSRFMNQNLMKDGVTQIMTVNRRSE